MPRPAPTPEQDQKEQEFVNEISEEFLKAAEAFKNVAKIVNKYDKELTYTSFNVTSDKLCDKLYDQFYNARSKLFEKMEECGWRTSSLEC